jgi:hypothetical protein
MEQPRKSRLSTVTLVVIAVVASLLLVLNLWCPYVNQPPQFVAYGWPMPTRTGQDLNTTTQITSWNIPHLIANLVMTLLLTSSIAWIVEWVMCGGKLPRFSLLSFVFAMLVAGLMMHVNFTESTTSSYGWPFTCGGEDESDLYGIALLGNIAIGLVFTLFGGLLCEYALGAIEDMRDYHRVHSGEVSWTTFAQDLHEKRKQEREGKTQSPEPDPPPSHSKPDEPKPET